MPVEFTAAQVEAVARLAQLALTAEEIELFARQLGEFLDYATQVLAVDTTGVEPTAYVVADRASDRADEAHASLDRDIALASAPDVALAAGLFKVPRVLG